MKPTRLGFYPFGVMLIRASVPLGPAGKILGTLGTLSLIVDDLRSSVETSQPYLEKYMSFL